MSRIGNAIINIPSGVEVNVAADNTVTVKGKLGELQQKVHPALKVEIADGVLTVKRDSDEKEIRAHHGLSRALIANMVQGVSEGYTTEQEFVGVGYRAELKGQQLELSLGYSHNVIFELPSEIKAETVTERGKAPLLKMTSHDKQLLGQVAAKIRSFRKPEPYKGKGIRFKGEQIRRKAGKAAGK